jgi:hypothetical protein
MVTESSETTKKLVGVRGCLWALSLYLAVVFPLDYEVAAPGPLNLSVRPGHDPDHATFFRNFLPQEDILRNASSGPSKLETRP